MTALCLKWESWAMHFEARPHIMGIVNVTPDSFSDGGHYFSPESAVEQGLRLVEQGADMVDVGGESTRPGSDPVSVEEELARVLPVIEALARKIRVPISIDTCKSTVAQRALEVGASMINDVSAGRFDPVILTVAARAGVPLIMMHMKGRPKDMQVNPVYTDLMGEIKAFLADANQRALEAGVQPDRIVLDPGIGFGKTFNHNLMVINRLRELTDLGRPLLVGPSRKAFLGHILGGVGPERRETATAAAVALAAYNGAHILRVHDVGMARETLAVVGAVMHERA